MTSFRLKIAVGTALLGLCSLAAYAQSTETPQPLPEGGPHGQWRGRGGPERELAMLTHQLNLTPEQQTGVKAVLEQQRSQMTALRAKPQTEAANTETPEAHQARVTQMNQIHDESVTKIAALLDDNQKKTFADLVAKRKAAMARRQGPEGTSAPAPN